MFTVVVQEKGGKTQRLQFNKGEITIGRVQGNDIVLPKGNVSKRHSKIVFKEGKFIVVDLKSTNGTYVNGHKIASPQVVKGTDKVFIGDFVLEIEEGAGGGAEMPPPMPPQPGRPPQPGPPRPNMPPMGGPGGMGGAPQPPMPATSPPPVPRNGPMMQGPPPRSAPVAQPMAPRGAWQEVNAQGAPPYKYLSIQGGWLVMAQQGVVFIPDPQHQYTPIPQ